jgi:hypothetical protein
MSSQFYVICYIPVKMGVVTIIEEVVVTHSRLVTKRKRTPGL